MSYSPPFAHLPSETIQIIREKSKRFFKVHPQHTMRVNGVGGDIKLEFHWGDIMSFMRYCEDVDEEGFSEVFDDMLDTEVG